MRSTFLPFLALPGIFKIEDSAQVARLWGQRKNRPAMNYDKLSRSIRQYYKKGIIRKPDMSQRLVYQFVHPVWVYHKEQAISITGGGRGGDTSTDPLTVRS